MYIIHLTKYFSQPVNHDIGSNTYLLAFVRHYINLKGYLSLRLSIIDLQERLSTANLY